VIIIGNSSLLSWGHRFILSTDNERLQCLLYWTDYGRRAIQQHLLVLAELSL
jgi:hypothetical protein